eukprot:scaffold12171_cov61-Phaeocystis_antarctica.AAC.8
MGRAAQRAERLESVQAEVQALLLVLLGPLLSDLAKKVSRRHRPPSSSGSAPAARQAAVPARLVQSAASMPTPSEAAVSRSALTWSSRVSLGAPTWSSKVLGLGLGVGVGVKGGRPWRASASPQRATGPSPRRRAPSPASRRVRLREGWG